MRVATTEIEPDIEKTMTNISLMTDCVKEN
jgi:hypothetical protein